MLALRQQTVRLCDSITRREWLRVGGLSSVGLMLPDLLRAREMPPTDATDRVFGRARSCIVCFLFGAPAHQDIWDLKPEAPSEVRGEFAPIETSVPGIRLGEHVPRIAAGAHRLAILRSVQHPDNTHTVAMHYMLTGHRHRQPATNPQNQPTDFPCFGAVMRYLDRGQPALPAGISLNAPANQVSANNHIFPGFFAGFLGNQYDPLFVADNPAAEAFCPFPAVEGAALERLQGRRRLLDEVDRQRRDLARLANVRTMDRHFANAYLLVTSPQTRQAFDLTRESDTLRQRYGMTPFGQGTLLARRLVEAGVRLVTVNWARDDAFWDTHSNNFKLLKESLLPPFDQGFSALLEDLDQRGLLDETLVVCLGEFGRTPKINGSAGRDHWAACNSVVLAGAGIAGGHVHGSSDRMAAFPTSFAVGPEDLAATIYHALGVPIGIQLRDRLDRPFALSTGRPLLELWGHAA